MNNHQNQNRVDHPQADNSLFTVVLAIINLVNRHACENSLSSFKADPVFGDIGLIFLLVPFKIYSDPPKTIIITIIIISKMKVERFLLVKKISSRPTIFFR